MIYKVTFHISTLYICQISSTQELSTFQDMQERKKKINTRFHSIHKKLRISNGKKILHNGEYQAR